MMVESWKLKALCGKHYLSGVELSSTTMKDDFYDEEFEVNTILFTLDGNNYMLTEDPCDGFRSCCEDLQVVEISPKFPFPPVEVLCHMMEDDYYNKNNCIIMRDIKNGKIILEAGTIHIDDYYPCCHFRWIPKNMDCNKNVE